MIYISFWLEDSHVQPSCPVLFLGNNISLMSAFFILVIASILVAVGFLLAFIWSVKNNQYEDRQGAAMRMLYDENNIESNE